MPSQTRPKGRRTLLAGCVFAALAAVHIAASDDIQVQSNHRILATADFTLTGLAVQADPAHQSLPRHTATVIQTSLAGLEGDASAILSQMDPDYRVRGQLIGPSLASPLELECPIGAALPVPPLSLPGDHLITNLRVVDTGVADSPIVAEVTPDTCSLSVFDQLLVSQVQVRELTYDEILSSGINVSQDSYSYYNFTLAIGTDSDGYKISIPIAMPVKPGDPPIAGPPQSSPQIGTTVPAVDVMPLFLDLEEGSGNDAPELEGGAIRIPGLIIFPGRIALLHQFFEAILIVSNGAPAHTPLVVHTLSARIELPQAQNPLDNPLRVADLQVGGRLEELDLHALGPDAVYGTQDDSVRFAPGESGQASFLIEGLKEGLHSIRFKLQGILDGLPAGPVKVRGEAVGAVRVRDASFAVSFTHPGLVRAAQEYDLGITLFNSGSREILGAYADLSPLRIVGAELADPSQGNQRSFPATVKPGESGTVTWRLRSRVTGAVTATFIKVEGATETCLELVTGVGDRNVPLSPDSLILPDAVRYLPPPVVEASSALLGQAWSIATAPAGTLPEGVLPISRLSVFDRAIELGVAGLRVRFGEPLQVALITLLRDWLGETQETPDLGFVETLCSTATGFSWQDRLGEQLGLVLGSQSADAFHQVIAEGELARSRFLSVLVTHSDKPPFVGVRLIDPQGRGVGQAGPQDRFGAVPAASMLRLGTGPVGQASSRGAFLLASTPESGLWTLELSAWQAGSVEISILLPVHDDVYRQLSFSAVSLAAGGSYRVRFDPDYSSGAVVERCSSGTCSAITGSAAVDFLEEAPPRLTGAVQVGPAVMEAGDRFGRTVALLFSKRVSAESAENEANYAIGGGTLVGSNPPVILDAAVQVLGAKLNFSNRFAFLKLSTPIGPLVRRTISLTGVADPLGLAVSPPVADIPIEITVSVGGEPPGGYLTGRALNADGTPVAGAMVDLYEWPCGAVLPVKIAGAKSDGAGQYAFDYVVNGECSPLSATATNLASGAQKQIPIPVIYHGQHLLVDFVFLARGRIQGEITLGGQPVPYAQVQIMSNSDPTVAQLAHADSTGKYYALDIPVGGVSVLAVGPAGQTNATGFGAGWIDGPGKTATVDVALQSISGSVEGQVRGPDGKPVSRMLVVAETHLAGFQDPVTLGYSYTAADGSFLLSKLPVTEVTVFATDYDTRLRVAQEIQLTSQTPSVTGVVLTLPGHGSISGRVVDQAGYYLPMAEVQCGFVAVTADPFGHYRLPMIVAGTHDVAAANAVTGLHGSTSVTVWAGQETTNANIVVSAAATIRGSVSIVHAPGLPAVPLSGVKVTYDGLKIATSNSQGAYVLSNVPPGGSFVLRFVHPAGRLGVNQVVTLDPGETLIRNVTFHPAAIGGKVLQPDGQTGSVARIRIYVPRPILAEGRYFGLLNAEAPITTYSEGDGTYLVSNLNPAGFRVVASNDFFPTPVGRIGVLLPDSLVTCNLTLIDTLGGAVKGRVFQPDGVTPAGEGIQVTLGGGHLADALIRTDSDGFYSFPEVFASGIYHLTAADPVTGYSSRVRISVVQNQDAITDIRLLGRGSIRTRVIDAAGSPVESGSVTVTGLDYPNVIAQTALTPGSDGAALLEDLPEGEYSVTASRQGLSGRLAVSIPLSGVVEVTVQLQASGSVTGRVLMPDGATPAGLADVRLILGGKILGYTLTSDDGDTAGTFSFPDVPLGDFKLEAFDNRSTRMGRTAGRLTQDGETATANIVLVSIGTVRGQVTANNAPVDHAYVTLESGDFGFSQTKLHATTDAAGNYSFPGVPVGSFMMQVIHQASGLTGSAEGILPDGFEPLPDKIVNITLEQSASLQGVVLDHLGSPVSGARVTVTIGSRALTSTSRADGTFRVDYVPLGEAMVRAEAPSGYDRGRTGPVIISQPGSTVPVEVKFDGVGGVQGDAFDSDGVTPLPLGTVTLTNAEWPLPVILVCPVARGKYEIRGAPAGSFSLKLTVVNRTAVGVAAATLEADETLNIPLKLDPAGTVAGRVVRPDGTTPAVGADVTLRVTRTGGGTFTYTAHTDAAGIYRLDQVLLGTIEISVKSYESDGLAGMSGLSLSINGEVLQVPLLVLDESPIEVQSVSPANGSIGVSRSTAVTVTFTEPAQTSTVNESSLKLMKGPAEVAANITLSADGMVATLTPAETLADNSTYMVLVTTQVTDLVGRHLSAEFRSTFATPDETPAVVTSIDPPSGATHVVLDKVIQVTFDEGLDPQQAFAGVVRLFPDDQPQALVPLVFTLSESGRTITADPSNPLAESTLYRIEVASQKDLAGNIQPALYTSTFSTVDRTKPVIDSVSVEGQLLFNATPGIVVKYSDDFSGIDTTSLLLTLDGQDIRGESVISANQANYQVPVSLPLTRGSHALLVQVSDNVGNQSDLKTAVFTVDDVPPEINSLTIAGVPALSGMIVNVSRPIVRATYSDNGSVNRNETRLLMGPEGGQLIVQAATVWSDLLEFQPSVDLPDGPYVLEVVVTDSLGNFTRSGLIGFVVQANGPQIYAAAPLSGTQHGGTVLVIEGARLLEQDGDEPAVRVAGNPAYVLSAEPGPPQRVTIVTPAGASGPALIELETEEGINSIVGFSYEPDSRTPFAVEKDTLLLWHLDEPWDGYVNIADAGPFAIEGDGHADSRAVSGRFAHGRSGSATVYRDYGLLNPADSSFTVEFFVKTLPVTRTYILAGKQPEPGGYGLSLLPSGAVRAWFKDGSSIEWAVATDPTNCTVIDDQWHYVGMVLDRSAGILRLYVDGAEKASSSQPAGFGDVMNTTQVAIGISDNSDQSPGPAQFNGSVDEVRISSSAHSASQIVEVLFGQDGPLPLVVGLVRPGLLRRGAEEEIWIYGYNLAGVEALLLDADGAEIDSQVLATSATTARLRAVIPAAGEVGEAVLQLHSSRGDASVSFRILDPVRSKPQLEPDTIVLWHFEGNGENGSQDDGPFALSWNAYPVAPGFYKDGRRQSFQSRQNDSLLDLGMSSLTTELWIRVGFNQTFAIASGSQQASSWQLQVSSSGSLIGSIWDQNAIKCSVEAPSKVVDPALGYPVTRNLDEPIWHHLAMVVDRATEVLKIYIDGYAAASVAIPTDFGPLRKVTGSSLRISGWFESLDEVRVSHTAHGPAKIWEDFAGTHPHRVTSVLPLPVTKHLLNRGVSTRLRIKGYDLGGLSAELRRGGLPIGACSIADASYSDVQVDFAVPSGVEPGAAEISLVKAGQSDVIIPVEIVDSQPARFERDTLLLWDLDESAGGATTIADSGPFRLFGTDGSTSKAVLGRFGNGRESPRIEAVPDEGLLDGSNGFTVQCWFKTSLMYTSGTYRLAGWRFNGGWNLLLMPTGTIRAEIQGNMLWQAEVPVIRYDSASPAKSVVLDNNWHMAVMVVDPAARLLSIYVDGSLRASSPMPAGFVAYASSSYTGFGLGHKYDSKYGPGSFPGVIDDVRVSLGPRAESRVWTDFAGVPYPDISRISPRTIPRDGKAGQAVDTEVQIEGYDLEGVSSIVTRDGAQIPGVTALTLETSYSLARVQITVNADAAIGLAFLRLMKPSGESIEEPIYIAESPSPALEADTVLLWHLDEPGNGEVSVVDSTPFQTSGKTDADSVSSNGRFGLGRLGSRITADPDYGVLNFGQSSFTVECWFKTANLQQAYTLLQLGSSLSLAIRGNGVLEALLYGDYQPNGYRTQWRGELKPFLRDESDKWSVRLIADEQWHSLSMVVDRNTNLLELYLDGVKGASSPMPAGFGTLFYDSSSRFSTGGSPYFEEFPGVIDEIKVSSAAHSEGRISAHFLGYSGPKVGAIHPSVVARGSVQFPVALHGFGLTGASVSADDPSVEITISSSAPNQLALLITVPDTRPAGTVRLTVTDPAGLSGAADLMITAPKRFDNPSLTDADTLVLWHLDETGTGAIPVVGSGDSIPAAIGATASTASLPVTGRFEGGRTLADLVATAGFGSSELGAESFAVDCWFKTRPVGRPYMLIGRSAADGYSSEFEITLLPSGSLTAGLRDASYRYWGVETPVTIYDQQTKTWNNCIVDDEQWHLVSLVVDRVTQQLLVYVDGSLRACAAPPSNFTTLLNANKRVRAGLRNLAAGRVLFPDSDQFPGVLDEIRVTKGTRIAEEIKTDFGLPPASPSALSDAVAELRPNHGVDGESNSARSATEREALENTEGAFAAPLLLWHLDEKANGAVRVDGAGDGAPHLIGGIASPASIAEEGRFGGGRTSAGVVADPDNGALDFGGSSFTVEFWLRTDPVFATYTLAGRDGSVGEAKDFGISVLPSGRLRAWLFDSAGLEWCAEPDISVDDSRWRLITMSVDREAGWLYLLVDDEKAAAVPCPAGFGDLRDQGQPFRAGHIDVSGPARYVAPAEFPGILDEMRILNYAREPGKPNE